MDMEVKKYSTKTIWTYDYENNCFICYGNKQLYHQDTKYKYNPKKDTTEVKAEFYNKEACEGCILKPGCCKGKKNIEKS